MQEMVKAPTKVKLETQVISPDAAAVLLEHNQNNRPISQMLVERIARQIADGKWVFNGDTIKISDDGGVLDGQHRLWAIIEAKRPVETVVVHGIKREAFATIDTVRRLRSGSDVLALNGVSRYRNVISEALKWLWRLQNGVISEFRDPKYRLENSDVENLHAEHPMMGRAVEAIHTVRPLGSLPQLACIYYLLSNRNYEIAEQMLTTLHDPSGAGVHDPFFRLRAWLLANRDKKKDPLTTMAMIIKAANFAAKKQKTPNLQWRSQGKKAEEFPVLTV